MNRKYPLSDEDKAAFQDAVNGVFHFDDASENGIRQDQPYDKKEDSVSLNYLSESDWVNGETIIQFSRQGVSTKQLKELAAGISRIDQRLDFHGYRREQLYHELGRSIHQARLNSARVLLIIHGKGVLDTEQPAPLKNLINQSLRQNPDVLAFHSARPAHGGAGATYVLLRKNAR